MRVYLSAALLCFSSAVSAQDMGAAVMNSKLMPTSPTGYGLPNDGPTQLLLARYGRCISSRYGGVILGVLPESDRDRESLAGLTLTPEHCRRFGNFYEVAPMFLRGSYAEYSLTHDFDMTTLQAKGRGEKIFPLPTTEQRQRLSDKQKAALSFVEYATCVAQSDMPGLAKLMSAEVGSTAEKAAFQALAPAMSQCLTPGMTVKINRLKLRGYLAEGGYRWLSSRAAR